MLEIKTENVYVINEQDKELIRLLSEGEKEIFEKFIQLLNSYQEQKKVTIVYRGEKKESLKEKFKEEYGTSKFFDYLFIIGEKAKAYFRQDIRTIERRPHLQSISDVSDETFCYIFREYNQIFKKLPSSNLSRKKKIINDKSRNFKSFQENKISNKQEKILGFQEKNLAFVNFFIKFSNIRRFLNTILENEDEEALLLFKWYYKIWNYCLLKEVALNLWFLYFVYFFMRRRENKITIRDYYLYFLHAYNLGDKSFFVSTSTKYDTARFFALKTKDNKDEKRSVIFYYFIPNPIDKYAVDCNSSQLGLGHKLCSKLNLPTYNETVYQDQEEVAVKGGLLPQYIFCIFDIENQIYIANPHLFHSYNSNNLEEIALNGLDIPQDRFNNIIKETDYKGFFIRWQRTGNFSDNYY